MTVLWQIEVCLNSRPLYPISNYPNDLSTLTLAHSDWRLDYSHTISITVNLIPTLATNRKWFLDRLVQRVCFQDINPHEVERNLSTANPARNNESCKWRVTELYPGLDCVIRTVQIKKQFRCHQKACYENLCSTRTILILTLKAYKLQVRRLC